MNLQPLWIAAEAAAACGGRTTRHWEAQGVSIDSRTLDRGDLFVALQGPHFDGHDFVAQALAKGAAAAMVSRVPEGIPENAPLLLVKDTMDALTELGRVARLRSRARVVGVTGSVGKTGTKELLRAALGDQGQTYASASSFNNQWGVPLSLARLPPGAAYGVFEIGMNHAGEIGPLSRLARPHVAIITTVEPVHIEFFSSVEEIADAKAEIFEGMTANGTAILNRDNPHYARLAAAARGHGVGRLWSFGESEQADARLLEYWLEATGTTIAAQIGRVRVDYTLSLPGKHWALNSLAVLLAVDALGADVPAAAKALGRLAPFKGRGARRLVELERGAFTLIDESYNASPIAMKAALGVLAMANPGPGGRRIAVLGDMLELGAQAEAAHESLLQPIGEAKVDLVFACGANMGRLFERLPFEMRGIHAESSDKLAVVVADHVRRGDVVLVKGSLGSRMARVVDALAALDRSVARTSTSCV